MPPQLPNCDLPKVNLCDSNKQTLLEIPPQELAEEITLLYHEYIAQISSYALSIFRNNIDIFLLCPAVTKFYEKNDIVI